MKSRGWVVASLICWSQWAHAADSDGDGYDSAVNDCDDANSSIYPGASNLTYGVDSDCDGNLTCYDDMDGDKHGTSVLREEIDADSNCNTGASTANDSLDCNDVNSAIYPGAPNL
ncbi:MAG TPA: putative metal-binding motif-containing protein, partial [Polyangiaceae bacterium]|nr:putative metal-binding motif-containing protein [Polyangiaceae bacterium]